ncbi:MAG: hypothetical protein IH991_14915 [Planctomycetes bacterium]|nr:hypothetical protein [Planctomycetota bacterium]
MAKKKQATKHNTPASKVAGAQRTGPRRNGKSDTPWQDRLLPVMVFLLVFVTAFFFVSSWLIAQEIQESVLDYRGADQESLLTLFQEKSDVGTAQLYLSACSMNLRHQQARGLLASRIWVQYMSFVTGMAMCMVGAAFILGKLKSMTEVSAKSPDIAMALKANSPGLVLAFLGTLLIVISLFSDRTITVEDSVTTVPSSLDKSSPQKTSLSAKEKAELAEFARILASPDTSTEKKPEEKDGEGKQ